MVRTARMKKGDVVNDWFLRSLKEIFRQLESFWNLGGFESYQLLVKNTSFLYDLFQSRMVSTWLKISRHRREETLPLLNLCPPNSNDVSLFSSDTVEWFQVLIFCLLVEWEFQYPFYFYPNISLHTWTSIQTVENDCGCN